MHTHPRQAGGIRWAPTGVTLWCLGLLLGLLPALPVLAARPAVLLYQPAHTPSLDRISQSLIRHLAGHCRQAASCPRVRIVERPPAPDAARRAALLIGLGEKAADTLARNAPATPQLHLLISRHAHQTHSRLPGVSALYMQQPLRRQLRFLRFLFPEYHRLGVLLGPASRHRRRALARAADELGLSLHSIQVDEQRAIGPSLRRLAGRSDILLALPDPLIYNRATLATVLLTSYHEQLPVFGFSAGMVRAGAVAALYSSADELGTEAADMAWRMLHSDIPAATAPRRFERAVNRPVAHALHLRLPTDAELAQWEPTE